MKHLQRNKRLVAALFIICVLFCYCSFPVDDSLCSLKILTPSNMGISSAQQFGMQDSDFLVNQNDSLFQTVQSANRLVRSMQFKGNRRTIIKIYSIVPAFFKLGIIPYFICIFFIVSIGTFSVYRWMVCYIHKSDGKKKHDSFPM